MPDSPHRRGRPSIDPDDGSCKVTITLPNRTYDSLHARATRERLTVPDLIRRELRRERQSDPPDR